MTTTVVTRLAPDTLASASAIIDPYVAGVASGWRIVDASTLDTDLTLDADIAIVGTGAGGGTAAEILSEAGFSVVMLEEGPLATSRDFRMRETDAYPQLYQESGARKTADKAINIMQGRCVGGGSTVNWTSSFRTPPATLRHWQDVYDLEGCSVDAMAPWFARMETRLSVAPWDVPPNANNAALARGASALGIPAAAIRRNVKGCWNLGYCGVGCPTNAKQSMLVTTIPAALARGATLVTRARAWRFAWRDERVTALEAQALAADGNAPSGRRITVRARHYISAAGAIGTPALLLRSALPDPHKLVGKRTFLHPTIVSAALMPERIDGYAGAPQTIYSDHYLDTLPLDGPIGFKLEAPPIHPVLAATTLPGDGAAHAAWMREFPHLQVVLALLRDGFHSGSQGGSVRLGDADLPVLDYPFTPYLWEGVRRSFDVMAAIQFAAGAKSVMPMHAGGAAFGDMAAARTAIAGFSLAPLATRVVSAHVMGGAPFGPDPRTAVVNPEGRHHRIENLHVFDASLFPTSVGANPQLTIYATAARLATALAARLV